RTSRSPVSGPCFCGRRALGIGCACRGGERQGPLVPILRGPHGPEVSKLAFGERGQGAFDLRRAARAGGLCPRGGPVAPLFLGPLRRGVESFVVETRAPPVVGVFLVVG